MTGFDGSEMDDAAEGAPGIGPAPVRGPYVIRILAANGYDIDRPTFLKSWDIEAHDGHGDAEGTAVLDDAHRFTSSAEALQVWRSVSVTRPTRDDGRPNRPLTTFTVEIVTLDEAQKEHP